MSNSKVDRLSKKMRNNGYDEAHPIDAADVDGKLVIIDGHHRAAAASKAGLSEVPVNVHSVSEEDAKILKAQAQDAKAERMNRCPR